MVTTRECILCLLSNVLKYSTEGTVVTVGISLVVRWNPVTSSTKDDEFAQEILASSRSIKRESPMKLTESRRRIFPSNPTVDIEFSLLPNTSVKDGLSNVVSEQHVHIEIADGGIGLSEEAMNNLFNPFQQAQKLAGGTGKISI